jgi:hypothetical protein
LSRQGLARVEVHVPKADAALVRDLARALNDPAQSAQVRAALKAPKSIYSGLSFKEFLALAPLEGIDLTRDKDTGRDIDL